MIVFDEDRQENSIHGYMSTIWMLKSHWLIPQTNPFQPNIAHKFFFIVTLQKWSFFFFLVSRQFQTNETINNFTSNNTNYTRKWECEDDRTKKKKSVEGGNNHTWSCRIWGSLFSHRLSLGRYKCKFMWAETSRMIELTEKWGK